MSVPYERFRIPVAGGSLAAGRWGHGDRIVVASHGITANHLSFLAVGRALVERSGGEISLVAVDHRGRAGSANTGGAYGLPAHADDLIAVLDHLEIDQGHLLGHSLGAFIVACAAEQHPERCARLTMIDGGVPFPGLGPMPEPDADIESLVLAVLGPALERLDMRFETIDHYLEFFQVHPAFAEPNQWTETVDAYVRYDAVATDDGDFRSSVTKDAVLVDGAATIAEPEVATAFERMSTPTTMLWASRGLMDETPGLYTAEYLAEVAERLPHLTPVAADDVNHYTIVTTDDGAAQVVDAVLG
ncbi:MAG: alpha/beta hydrolase [Actinomycetota bacterium]